MSGERLQRTERRLPHWKLTGSTYFVTYRVYKGTLTDAERQIVLEHLQSGDKHFYHLLAAVVMPDHVHLLLNPQGGYDLSRVMKGIKGVSSRLINKRRGTVGRVWQDESYDRIMRSDDEFLEKLEYLLNNPVRAGLVTNPSDYPFTCCDRQACFGQTGMSAPQEETPQTSLEDITT